MSLCILGGGVTGLSAGMVSGAPVYEASDAPGGICSSYYLRPGESVRRHSPPEDGEAYRFEIGGGHWIFGGDPTVLRFLEQTAPVGRHNRISGVWFMPDRKYVPYPLQNHLRYLGEATASKALQEMSRPVSGECKTMHEWLLACFGETLSKEFFVPFHELYTAGLHTRIAPQDGYKSPVNLASAIQGAFGNAPAVGYNVTFIYPREGLDALAKRMAERCDMRYGKQAVAIDVRRKEVAFNDGSTAAYDVLLCTLPLDKTLTMAGVAVDVPSAPYSSTLVLNIGGKKGPSLLADHWLYHPRSKSGFHRVGMYSNVDNSFLPQSCRDRESHVSFYVERAYVGGNRPSDDVVEQYARDTVAELIEWGFLEEAEVVDPTWIDVAYTWSDPGSAWKPKAIKALEEHGIYMVGRYARWVFQGIADSIRDGFYAGASLRS